MAARKKGEPPNRRKTSKDNSRSDIGIRKTVSSYKKGEPPNRKKRRGQQPIESKTRTKRANQRKNSRTIDKGNPKSTRNLQNRVVGYTSDGKKVYQYPGR